MRAITFTFHGSLMDPQEGDTADLPDGRVAVFTNGRWVVRGGASPQQAPAQRQGYTFQPMQSPSDRRAEAAAERAERTEARAVDQTERQISRDERADTRAFAGDETALRREFEGLQPVKDYRTVAASYGMMEDALGMETAAGDMAGIFTVMRMLDPTSVVREGEYATAQNAGAVPDRILDAYNRAIDGVKLTPRQRADFLSMGAGVLEVRGREYNQLADRYRGLAEQYGYSPDNVAAPVEFRPGETPRTAVDSNDREAVALLKKGDWILVDGRPRRLADDPQIGVAEGREVGPGVFTTEDDLDPPSATGAFSRSFMEQIPFVQDMAAAMSPLGYSNARDVFAATGARDREMQPLARDAGGVAGFAASLAVPGGAVTKGVSRLTGAGRAASTIGAGALEGGIYAAGTTRGDVDDRLIPTMVGTGLGAFGGAVASRFAPNAVPPRGGSGVSSPRASMVRTLDDAGVFLTPGQRMGGLVGTVENIAQRAPILGPAIRAARSRSEGSLNRAVGLRALENIDEALPGNIEPGGDMVQFVGQRLGQEFDKGYKMVERFIPDRQLLEAYENIRTSAADLPASVRDQFSRIVESRADMLARGASGEQVGRVRSGLSQLAAEYSKAPDPDQRMLGGLIFDVVGQIDDRVGRINPEAGRVLNNAREGYGDYIRMERASTAAGGRPFGPGQLESAVRQADSSVRRGAVGRGEARMQDLSRAAREVMPDQFGNPGSADSQGLAAMGVGFLTAPVTTSAIAGGLAAAATPYLAMGRKVLERLPSNPTKAQIDTAAGQLDELSRRDPNVARLRDQLIRRAPVGATGPVIGLSNERQRPPSMTNPGF